MDRSLIDSYENRASKLKNAIQGLTNAQLCDHPIQGTWSIQQLIAHVMDSDQVASFRMKSIIAHENPVLLKYDVNAFIHRLRSQSLDVEISMEAFAANRKATATMLRLLPDEDFERQGQHEERGPLKLSQLIELYIWHVDHHLKFLNDKKVAMGV